MGACVIYNSVLAGAAVTVTVVLRLPQVLGNQR